MDFSSEDIGGVLTEGECFQVAQESLVAFTQVLKPDYQPGQFHVELAENLEKVENGELDRLAISAPPGHGKPVSVDSEILMGDGTQKKLKDIEVGDDVITHEGRPREVREVHEQGVLDVLKIKTYCGREIELAPDHPVLTPRGFVQAGQLEEDMRVAALEHIDQAYFADKIELIEKSGQSECRCLTVDEDSTFVADSIVVHNSLLCSIMFPIWCLGRDPTRRVIQASYSSDLSEDFSMKARDRVWNDEVFREIFPGCRIDPGKRGKSQWSLTEGGYYLATGTGGSCTGKRAELLLIDDPHKDWEKSHSPREKEKVWNWFQSTASSRLTKDGKIILIQTRWAHDDLIGRIQDTNPQDWKFINYPAIDDNNEALCPHLFPLENLKKKKENTNLRIWLSLYQGMPVKGEGAEMDMDMFNRVSQDEVPDEIKWVRGWDLAFTTGRNSARTASVKLGKDKENGEYYLKDFIRGKWKWKEVKNLVVDTAKQEGCIIAIGTGGTQVKEYQEIKDELQGHIPTSAVKKIPERSDKNARIRQWASKVETGNFHLVEDGSNWEKFLYEAHHFPDGKHDDSLDAVSDAFEELNKHTGQNATGFSTPTQIPKSNQWQKK